MNFARLAKRVAGVTIIELMIVLAIVGVLLALLFPAIQSVRERARDTVCSGFQDGVRFMLNGEDVN